MNDEHAAFIVHPSSFIVSGIGHGPPCFQRVSFIEEITLRKGCLMKTIRIAVAMVILLAAVSAFALSDQYVQFGKGPAQWIMTKDEAAQWKKIGTDADAQAFIDLFWAKRDTTPGTPDNEFKDLFEARVKYADEHFAHGRTKGSMTDRGRVLIVMGSPSRIQRTGSEPQATIQTPDRPVVGNTMPGSDAQASTIQGYSP